MRLNQGYALSVLEGWPQVPSQTPHLPLLTRRSQTYPRGHTTPSGSSQNGFIISPFSKPASCRGRAGAGAGAGSWLDTWWVGEIRNLV